MIQKPRAAHMSRTYANLLAPSRCFAALLVLGLSAAPAVAQDYSFTGLGFLPGAASPYSYPYGVSGDGSTVVGQSRNAAGQGEAFRWTSATGMQGLGFLPGAARPYSYAHGVSDDGGTAVGYSSNAAGQGEAFRWTTGTGMESLGGLLASEGVDMTGVTLQEAQGISDDGSVITGYMRNASGQNEAYLAVYDTSIAGVPPVAGVIAPANYAASVAEVSRLSQGVAGQANAGLRQLLHVARNYELAPVPEVVTRGIGGLPNMRYGAFAYGDVLWGQNSSAGQARSKDGTAGLIGQTSTGFRFGVGLEIADLERTKGLLGGSVEADGFGGAAFVAYEPQETGLRAYMTASVLKLDADIDRNYTNGAAVETSKGRTDGNYKGVEVELGYAFSVTQRSAVTPFVSYQFSKSEFDGYTEKGGTFPGAMSNQSAEFQTASVGVSGTQQVSDKLEVTGSIAYGRTSETVSAPGLAVVGLGGLQFSGASGDRDFGVGSLNIGMNYAVSERTMLYSNIETLQALDAVAKDIDAVIAQVGVSFAF